MGEVELKARLDTGLLHLGEDLRWDTVHPGVEDLADMEQRHQDFQDRVEPKWGIQVLPLGAEGKAVLVVDWGKVEQLDSLQQDTPVEDRTLFLVMVELDLLLRKYISTQFHTR